MPATAISVYLVFFPNVGGTGKFRESLKKTHVAMLQSMVMCKVEGARLSNHIISTVSTADALSCAAQCAAGVNCKSANYNIATGNCELNDISGPTDEGIADYDNTADSNNIYYHSLEC